jgi:hypothetical protein
VADDTLKTQLALTKKDTSYLRQTLDEIKKDFKEFKDDIKKNFVTKTTVKLSIAEALDNHKKEEHKGPLTSSTIRTALIIIAASGAGGAGGHTIKEIVAALIGG